MSRLGSSLRARKLALSSLLRVALASSQARTSLRKAASSGVSLKSMVLSSGRVLLLEAGDQLVLPRHRPADVERHQPGAAQVELGVGLPGEADAAMGLDVLLGGKVIRFGGGDAR